MKKRILELMLSTLLVVVFATVPNATLSYAACKCTCKVACSGTCSYQCSGCGLQEGAEAAAQCCENASPGPCEEENY